MVRKPLVLSLLSWNVDVTEQDELVMISNNPLMDGVKTSEHEISEETPEQHSPDASADVAAEDRDIDPDPVPEEPQPSTAPPAETEAAVGDAPSEPAPPVPAAPSAPSPPPRPRLNPTVNPAMAKAVPWVTPAAAHSAEVSEPPPEAPPSEAPSPDESAKAAEPAPSPPPKPVELPSEEIALDAALEAEIEAAFQAEETMPAAAEVPQADEEADAAEEGELAPGSRLKGKVQSVHGDNVFFDVGGRSPGVVSARQFLTDKPPAVGDEFDLVVDRVDEAEGLVLLNLPRGRRSVGGNWDAVAKGQVVDCMVTKTNKGGLEVTVSSLRGFMPASQVDLTYVGDLDAYVGQKLQAVITEANPKKRNLVVSRRAYLEIERKEAAQELWKSLAEGQEFTGTVKTIKDYGAFVDIGGIDGFLHVGEISWTRINHPGDVLSQGQQVQVQIVKLDRDKKRISLGMKQLKADPWTVAAANYPAGSAVSGRVTRTMDFGAFVELEPGVEGLVHISELDHQRVNKVTDVLQVDQQVELKVLEVDQERRRIGLSLKQLKEKPPELQKTSLPGGAASDEEADSGPPVERKRKGPLKGGTGPEKSGGGLFGNPKDFS